MTSNMISFRKYEEDVRHNREMERLTGEQQAEAVRHNIAVEEENVRTNKANEAVKRTQNAINATHYTTMDAETNRHNAEVEYYTWEQPIIVGKQRSEMAHTDSETGKNYAQTKKTNAETLEILTLLNPKADKINSEILLNSANALLSSMNVFKSASDVELNQARTEESRTKSVSNVTKAGTDIVRSASDMVKAVSLFMK